jgi:serine/threonine protein kinase
MPTYTEREVLDRYVIYKELGNGSFGLVMKAYDKVNHRNIALKFIVTKGLFAKSLGEFSIAQRIDSPYSVKYFEAIYVRGGIRIRAQDKNKIYDLILVMELINGTDMWDYINDIVAHMSREEHLESFMQVAHDLVEGLADMHRSVRHQDVKPENIMIEITKGLPHAVYVDFGLSCCTDTTSSMKCVPTTKGTLEYISPDKAGVLLGDNTEADSAKSDVYGMGLSLLAMANRSTFNLCKESGTECARAIKSQDGIYSILMKLDMGNVTVYVQNFLQDLLAATDRTRVTAGGAVSAFRELHSEILNM